MADKIPFDDREREKLSAFLDGEVDAKTAQEIEAKLSQDPDIRRELESLRQTWKLLDRLPRLEPAPDFTQRTMERLTGTGSRRERAPWRVWSLRLTWAAAVLVAAAVGYEGVRFLSRHGQQPAEEQLFKDLRVVDNARPNEHVDDIDFLHQLANPNDPDLFGEDGVGS